MQLLVFALVGSSFTVVYITQPILPILETEFGVEAATASLSVSAVIFGITLANLPFGILADRYAVKPIFLVGGAIIATTSLVCALTHQFAILVAARLIQGLFVPAQTTCIAAYLARSLPNARLNIVMGSYVAATVAGGLGGRLLGGWVHPPLHWRYAFVSAAALVVMATAAAYVWLPQEKERPQTQAAEVGFLALLMQPALLRMFATAFGAFFVFSSTFNYLPFYLSKPPLSVRTEVITLMYLAYLVGIVMAPISGRLSNRLGSGATMVVGSVIFALAILASLVPSLPIIAASLVGACAGFFSIHAAAVGLLNRRLAANRGRANSLYVLCYYAGGGAGITACGYAYVYFGWTGTILLNSAMLLLPLAIGCREIIQQRRDIT